MKIGADNIDAILGSSDLLVDAFDAPGQATCEGGEHLPIIGVLSATLARCIQDFVQKKEKWDAMVTLYGVTMQR